MYNPGVQDRSGELLVQGILSGAQGLASALERRATLKRQEYDMGKAAEMFVKAKPELLKEMGFADETEFKNLSARDKAASVTGYVKRLGVEEARRGAEIDELRKKDLQAQIDTRQGDALSDYLYNRQVAASRVPPQLKAVVGDLASPTFAPLDLAKYASESPWEQPAPSVPDLRAYMARSGMRPERQMQMAEALKAFGALEQPPPLPLGATIDLPGGGRLIGTGGEPKYEPPQKVETKPDPKLLPAIDPNTGKPIPGMALTQSGSPVEINRDRGAKLTEGDKAFKANAKEMITKLDELDSIIEKHGNFELVDASTSAKLRQLPLGIAVNYAKIVDPASVAREGEVAAAQKYMLPTGLLTRNAVSKAAIAALKAEALRRLEEFNKVTNPEPSNGEQSQGSLQKFHTEAEAKKAGLKPGDKFLYYDPKTARWVTAMIE